MTTNDLCHKSKSASKLRKKNNKLKKMFQRLEKKKNQSERKMMPTSHLQIEWRL